MLEYHHFAIPNELMDLGNDQQWLQGCWGTLNEWIGWTTPNSLIELNIIKREDNQTLYAPGVI